MNYEEQWVQLAVCLGFNELVKHAQSLEERVDLRALRDLCVARFREATGGPGLIEDDLVLEIPALDGFVPLKFRATDIEAMRQAVAKWDAAQ